MRTYLLIISLLVLCSSSSSFAQSNDQKFEKQKEYNSKIQHHSQKIKYGESRTQREHVQNSEEIGKNLDSAVTNHEEIKKTLSKKQMNEVKEHNTAVEKHHSDAKKHHQAMQTELSKPKHSESAVRHHASHVSISLEKAEREEATIQDKTKKKRAD